MAINQSKRELIILKNKLSELLKTEKIQFPGKIRIVWFKNNTMFLPSIQGMIFKKCLFPTDYEVGIELSNIKAINKIAQEKLSKTDQEIKLTIDYTKNRILWDIDGYSHEFPITAEVMPNFDKVFDINLNQMKPVTINLNTLKVLANGLGEKEIILFIDYSQKQVLFAPVSDISDEVGLIVNINNKLHIDLSIIEYQDECFDKLKDNLKTSNHAQWSLEQIIKEETTKQSEING